MSNLVTIFKHEQVPEDEEWACQHAIFTDEVLPSMAEMMVAMGVQDPVLYQAETKQIASSAETAQTEPEAADQPEIQAPAADPKPDVSAVSYTDPERLSRAEEAVKKAFPNAE